MTVSSTDSTHRRHHFLSSSRHSNQKIHHSPKAKKKFPDQQTLATVAGKQDIGAVDSLKRTRTEIEAEYIIYREISKKYCQVNRSIDICLHSLSHVLAKARGSNTISLYTRHFSKWQQWVSQFPNTKAIPADDTYVIAYMLNLFQKNKSFENIRNSFFAIKYFQKITGYENVLTGGLPYLVLEGIKRTSQKILR